MLVIGQVITMATHMFSYCTTLLKHPTLTRIHGEPTFEGIIIFHKEVMVIGLIVHSELASGAHGHSGLVLSPRRYALFSNAVYNQP